jgi:hypothetical protein
MYREAVLLSSFSALIQAGVKACGVTNYENFNRLRIRDIAQLPRGY